jgi:propanol-preferring alcohol dehydrogenase
MATTEQIPKKQKAVVYEKCEGDLTYTDINVAQELDADDILVKIIFSGVCHTDIHVWMGDLPVKNKEFPIVGGHEGAGIVVKVGNNVKNFKVGDRAGVQVILKTFLTHFFSGLIAPVLNASSVKKVSRKVVRKR